MKQIPVLGDFCVSLAGHDKGQTYIIVKIVDSEFVWVCDGQYHKTERPKKKRAKHIQRIGARIPNELLQQILNGTVTDNEIHKAILKEGNRHNS